MAAGEDSVYDLHRAINMRKTKGLCPVNTSRRVMRALLVATQNIAAKKCLFNTPSVAWKATCLSYKWGSHFSLFKRMACLYLNHTLIVARERV